MNKISFLKTKIIIFIINNKNNNLGKNIPALTFEKDIIIFLRRYERDR